MKKIAVVGGGLAGLAAAYTLGKQGDCEVTLFESTPYLGGRTQSRMVRGQNVDFGGFLIYPWYNEAHALFKNLGIEDQLSKTPLKEIYYFLDHTGAVKEGSINFPKMDMVKIWSKSIFKLIPQTNVASPNLDIFEHKTISDYLRSSLDITTHAGIYETFFDTVNQGYCYGPAEQSKIAFMAPFIRQTALFGDIHRTSFFPQGTQLISDRLAEEIRSNGGIIQLSSPVTGIDGLTIKTEKESSSFDAIIFAQTVSDLYQTILPEVKPEIWYTHFVTVTVELSRTPIIDDTQEWGAAFYSPEEQKPFQALSVINLTSLYGDALSNCVTMNIILRSNQELSVNSDELYVIVTKEIERLFPEQHVVEILESIHWKKTMPVAQESFVEAIRNLQGKNGYFFAGDFLGAPSIETAIATGVQAARRIINLKRT